MQYSTCISICVSFINIPEIHYIYYPIHTVKNLICLISMFEYLKYYICDNRFLGVDTTFQVSSIPIDSAENFKILSSSTTLLQDAVAQADEIEDTYLQVQYNIKKAQHSGPVVQSMISANPGQGLWWRNRQSERLSALRCKCDPYIGLMILM